MGGLSWFELDVDFPDHPKCVRLGRLLRNDVAYGYVLRLWAYCYRHVTDRFDDADDVERAAGWRGKPGVFVDAARRAEFLDEGEGGALIAHGVRERLEPHLARLDYDRKRAKERRDELAKSVGRPKGVPRASDGRPFPPNQTRPDQTDPGVASQPDHPADDPPPADAFRPAGPELERVRGEIAKAYGRSEPLGLGKDVRRVHESFGRWLRTVGVEQTVAECLRLASEKHEEPWNLSWWPGWLDTVPDQALERAAARTRGGRS